jgi:pimeloyl-ACP methyl ester carboxylesterase
MSIRVRPRHSLIAAAAVAAALTASLTPAASADGRQARDSGPKPTIVLVHGAFADGSGWNDVSERLQKEGYKVVVPAPPLRGLPSDTAYINSVLKSVTGPIVLVGHSYGGAIISGAATGNPNVKALVYVSAFMPDEGETLAGLSGKFTGAQLGDNLKQVPFSNGDGTSGVDLYVDPAAFHQVFANGLPSNESDILAASQRPLSARAFSDAAGKAAWHTVPSWAVVAKQDRAIAPNLERFEAKRAHSRTVEVSGGHLAMMIHPAVVTDVIEDAARSTSH